MKLTSKERLQLFMFVTAGVLIAAFLVVLIFLNINQAGSEQTKDFNSTFINIIILVFGFYWGSSRGSSEKNDTIENLQNNKQ